MDYNNHNGQTHQTVFENIWAAFLQKAYKADYQSIINKI